jgi:hypothetical protein
MPRQPFLPTFAKLRYSIGALMLKERPDFCAALGKCVAVWTYVDNEMGNLFSILLGTESEAALEVFLSLRRSSTQREALEAAAMHSLAGDDHAAFKALMAIYKSLESQRNDLAHGCFGICTDDPSLLLWIDVKHHVHFQTEVLSKEAKGQFPADPHARLRKYLYVYQEGDLVKLYIEMEEFWWALFHFTSYLRQPTNAGRVAKFREMCALPKIRHEISRLQKG